MEDKEDVEAVGAAEDEEDEENVDDDAVAGLNNALGMPHGEFAASLICGGVGKLAWMSAGMAERGKNQIATCSCVCCMAKTPPLLLLKLVPYDFVPD